MPRSDDWTIHMPNPLIKRGAGLSRFVTPRGSDPRRAAQVPVSQAGFMEGPRASGGRARHLSSAALHEFFLRACREIGARRSARLALNDKRLKYSLNRHERAALRRGVCCHEATGEVFLSSAFPSRRRAWSDATFCAMPNCGGRCLSVPYAR